MQREGAFLAADTKELLEDQVLIAPHSLANAFFSRHYFSLYFFCRDGRMTVRLLKKYLVSKLGLEDESEFMGSSNTFVKGTFELKWFMVRLKKVQIWCRGSNFIRFHPAARPIAYGG
ncbi:hypothetical protein HPP92_023034 [Vanilla planifolia]|uniref:Uncharacterized protein n=1 Tax=Vanilla planifolia TaxID=51239 RepID=A0A835PUP5_VANPL|nr:hypothetical protein HPP92_023034 [Vanilla planifolia]